MREIRARLAQSFALLTRQLAFNRNAAEVGGHFQDAGLRWAGTARFAVIHGKGTQGFARMGKYGSGPAGAESVWRNHFPVCVPKLILKNVGDDDRFSTVHRGAA